MNVFSNKARRVKHREIGVARRENELRYQTRDAVAVEPTSSRVYNERMRRRLPWLASIGVALVASWSAAQIPEAPGSAPRDENPGRSSGGLAPAVVPTEPEASAPEIVDLVKRSRANAEATKTGVNAKNGREPSKKPTPSN